MPSRYAKNPFCEECPRKKSPLQVSKRLCTTCQRAHIKARSAQQHGDRIEVLYGITAAMYKALLVFQRQRCFICRRATGRSKRLAVDHNHKCPLGEHPANMGCVECVRGLLCSTCNIFIGRMRDDPTVGERMAYYLREPPFQRLRSSRPDWSPTTCASAESGTPTTLS